MEIALLYIAAFLRPIFFIDLGDGANLFDFAAIAIFAMLMLAFLSSAAQTRQLTLSGIDLVIVGFAIWCLIALIIYFDKANPREVAKLLIPLFTFIVAKNVMRDEHDYRRMLQLMVIGFTIPAVGSAALIIIGQGVETTNYWTGLARYAGMFSGSHTMGHSMTFLIMLIVLVHTLSRHRPSGDGRRRMTAANAGMMLLAAIALFCLYKSQVRTAMLGLLVFVAVYLYFYNKRLLVIGSVAGAVLFAIVLPILVPVLFFDLMMAEKVEGKWSVEDIGSGRQDIWAGNLERFSGMPLDRQLAGAGIGNKVQLGGGEGIVDSHSDVLDILVQTGMVGLLLYVVLQASIFLAILRLPRTTRPIFLAIFLAVTVMNFVSNSYVSRFGLAQMLYIALAFVQLPQRAPVEARDPSVVRA